MSDATRVADFCAASFSGNVAALKAMLAAPDGLDVNGLDATGMTALTRAAIAGNDTVVKLLLANKVDASKRDQVRVCARAAAAGRVCRRAASLHPHPLSPPPSPVGRHGAALRGLLRL